MYSRCWRSHWVHNRCSSSPQCRQVPCVHHYWYPCSREWWHLRSHNPRPRRRPFHVLLWPQSDWYSTCNIYWCTERKNVNSKADTHVTNFPQKHVYVFQIQHIYFLSLIPSTPFVKSNPLGIIHTLYLNLDSPCFRIDNDQYVTGAPLVPCPAIRRRHPRLQPGPKASMVLVSQAKNDTRLQAKENNVVNRLTKYFIHTLRPPAEWII